jgi:hypothetical protein
VVSLKALRYKREERVNGSQTGQASCAGVLAAFIALAAE